MITIRLLHNDETITVSPLSCSVPNPGISETLQHQEQTCTFAVPGKDLLSIIMTPVMAQVYDDDSLIFTGLIDSDLSWNDNGDPYPVDRLSLTIKDNTYRLQCKAEEDYSRKNQTLADIIRYVTEKTGLEIAENSLLPNDIVPVISFAADTEYAKVINQLLFEYGYSYVFDEIGNLKVVSITPEKTSVTITDSDILAPLSASRKRKHYSRIKIKYGNLIVKTNEQVYWEGNDLAEDYTVTPITLRPNQYYPYESDPAVESREGQIYQTYQNGYAESYQLYSGEQRFRRTDKTRLVYSENHRVVTDWNGNISLNRTEFTATKASVRLLNTGTSDAQLYQLAIRADAYYRADAYLERGTGRTEYSYESQYIYDVGTAEKLSAVLDAFYVGGNISYTFKSEMCYPVGTCAKIVTDASGIESDFFILSSEYDAEKEIYTHKALSYGAVSVISHRSKEEPNLSSLPSNIVQTIETVQQTIIPPSVTLENLKVTAEKDGIRFNYEIKNSKYFARLIIQLKKGLSDWKTLDVDGNLYRFDRKTDGYPERDELATWTIRAKIENIYGKTSANWTESQVNTDNYGTWLIPPLSAGQNISAEVIDRTVLLKMSASTPSLELYGNVKYKVSIKLIGITGRSVTYPTVVPDTHWYKPDLYSNPLNSEEGGELAYKVADSEDGFEVSTGRFSQTLPLAGQSSDNIVDTVYSYRISARNESGYETPPVVITVTALCTSIRDIVKANADYKTLYVEKLSTISANVGFISQGGMGDFDTNGGNYWALSDLTAQDTGVRDVSRGEFRVGDENNFIKVSYVKRPDGGKDAILEFAATGFTVTATTTEFSKELIVRESNKSLDQTRITPNGTFYEHRKNTQSSWETIAKIDTGGVIVPSYTAEKQIYIGNDTQLNQRRLGHDIGRKMLSDQAKVWHFDDNLFSQNQTMDGLTLRGTTELVGEDDDKIFIPAILREAPYTQIAKSVYGKFCAEYTIPEMTSCTVDFWFQYWFNESQVLFDIGTPNDKIKLTVKASEPEAVVSGWCEWYHTSGKVYTRNRNPNVSDNVYESKSESARILGTIDIIVLNEDYGVESITVNATEYVFNKGNPDFNWEVFAPRSEWQNNSSLFNRANDKDTILSHYNQTQSEDVSFRYDWDKPSFKEGEWYHCGITFSHITAGGVTVGEITFIINDDFKKFNRYSVNKADCAIVINQNESCTALVDELYIDTVTESEADFIQNTIQRIPWGSLDYKDDWFIFDAKNTSKIKSNILDWFRDNLLASKEFADKVKEIMK